MRNNCEVSCLNYIKMVKTSDMKETNVVVTGRMKGLWLRDLVHASLNCLMTYATCALRKLFGFIVDIACDEVAKKFLL